MYKNKVSIIIPTYKRSDRVERAVKSALQQDYHDFEVIVVDDNNPDHNERKKTEDVLSKYYQNQNFKYIKHPKNMNGSAARNTGVRNSTGEYITFLDDDDEYYNNKIRLQVECLSNLDSSWGLCYTGYDKIDQYQNIQTSSESVEGDVLIQSLTKNLFIGSGSNYMVRRNVLEEINGFDETFNRNQDLEFMVRVLLNYKIKHINYRTFLIHNEIREVKYSYAEMLEINDKYKKEFKKIIMKLDEDSQIEVYKTLDLWDIRFAIGSFKILETIKIFSRSKLTIKEVIKYLKYLITRFIKKTSYGFKL